MGQKPALPHRSIAVRFAPNKQTLAERVQCDAMCQNLTYALQQMTMQNDAFASRGRLKQRGRQLRRPRFVHVVSSTSPAKQGTGGGRVGFGVGSSWHAPLSQCPLRSIAVGSGMISACCGLSLLGRGMALAGLSDMRNCVGVTRRRSWRPAAFWRRPGGIGRGSEPHKCPLARYSDLLGRQK
jgi:hypothetical protein